LNLLSFSFGSPSALAKQIPPNRFVRAHRPEEICARNLRGQRAHSAAGANGKPNA